MLVLKFGGTSVGSAERILHAAAIVLKYGGEAPVVVTSAMSGVTDSLLAAHASAASRDHDYRRQVLAIQERHRAAAQAIDSAANWCPLEARLAALATDLTITYSERDDSARMRDRVASWGEQLAVLLVAGAITALGGSGLAAETPLIVTDEHFGAATPLAEPTRSVAQAAYAHALTRHAILVVPGFIGQSRRGNPHHPVMTTLGRGGSDYAATLIAVALGASACHIYTDVDGIFSADPRIVPDAQHLPSVSYATAGRLASSGAKVLHPRSVAPAAQVGLPLRVCNSFRPEHPGTLITALAGEAQAITAIAAHPAVTLLSLTGAGLAAIPNAFVRLCAALGDVEPLLTPHPVPGHDPQVVVFTAAADSASERITAAFAAEIAAGVLTGIARHDHLATCTVVSADISYHTAHTAQRSLARQDITPRSTVIMADSMTFLLPAFALTEAIRTLHAALVPRERELIAADVAHCLCLTAS